jgi:hypothetical protein
VHRTGGVGAVVTRNVLECSAGGLEPMQVRRGGRAGCRYTRAEGRSVEMGGR